MDPAAKSKIEILTIQVQSKEEDVREVEIDLGDAQEDLRILRECLARMRVLEAKAAPKAVDFLSQETRIE